MGGESSVVPRLKKGGKIHNEESRENIQERGQLSELHVQDTFPFGLPPCVSTLGKNNLTDLTFTGSR